MKRTYKLLPIAALSISLLILSGCSLPGTGASSAGSILKTTNGGERWEAKVKIDDKQTISAVDILSMAMDPADSQIVYIGTVKNGLYVTRNGGEQWEKINFPLTNIYGLAIDNNNSQIIYASGIWQKKGKIYKSENRGADWKEIYTEPAEGTTISSLEISKFNSQLLYAGTSEGMIIKTVDGGASWKNLYKSQGPIIRITYDPGNDSDVYFGLFNKGILRTKDGATSFEDLSKNIQKQASSDKIFSLVIDPSRPGVIYAGLDKGIAKSNDYGDNWQKLNIIKSAEKYSIRAIAVNPQNSNEIIFASAQALYKSVDGGVQWSTFQLNVGKSVEVLKYDPLNPANIYLGFRKL